MHVEWDYNESCRIKALLPWVSVLITSKVKHWFSCAVNAVRWELLPVRWWRCFEGTRVL